MLGDGMNLPLNFLPRKRPKIGQLNEYGRAQFKVSRTSGETNLRSAIL